MESEPLAVGDRVVYHHGHGTATVKATVMAFHASGVELLTDDAVRGYDRVVAPESALTRTAYVSLDTLLDGD